MNIFKINDFKIKINIFMLLMIVLYFYFGYFIEVFIMFLTVLVHEISHIIAARRYGFKVDEIEIFPFGGIARFEDLKTIYPGEEVFICAMGPLSNFIIMILFIGIKSFYTNSYIINYIIEVNKLMFILNLLPVLPLDGGKILRTILSLFIGYKSSTIKLVYITYIICTFIILYDILNGIIGFEVTYLSTIAVFAIIAAKKEKEMAAFVFIRSITRKTNDLNKKKKMKVHILVCIKTVNIKEAIECFLPNRYHIFIIIKSNGETIGTITEGQLLEGIFRYGLDITLENLLIESKEW